MNLRRSNHPGTYSDCYDADEVDALLSTRYTAADMREAFCRCGDWMAKRDGWVQGMNSITRRLTEAEALRRWPDKEEK